MAYAQIVGSGVVTDREFWLRAAHQAVRSECGWHVAPVITESFVLDGHGGHTLVIPSGRLRTVISATSDGVDVLDAVGISNNGMLELRSREWSRRFGGISITVTHGYLPDEVDDLAGLITTLAARGASNPAGVVSQSIGPAAVRYGEIPLMASERDLLSRYRI